MEPAQVGHTPWWWLRSLSPLSSTPRGRLITDSRQLKTHIITCTSSTKKIRHCRTCWLKGSRWWTGLVDICLGQVSPLKPTKRANRYAQQQLHPLSNSNTFRISCNNSNSSSNFLQGPLYKSKTTINRIENLVETSPIQELFHRSTLSSMVISLWFTRS